MKTLSVGSDDYVTLLIADRAVLFRLATVKVGDLLLTEIGTMDGVIDCGMFGRVTDVKHSEGTTTITYNDPLSLIRKAPT